MISTQLLNWSQNCELDMPGFGGKTGPFPMVLVFRVVRPVATVRFRVEPYPESTREIGPVANTICLDYISHVIDVTKELDAETALWIRNLATVSCQET
jgi:hypothetical protein